MPASQLADLERLNEGLQQGRVNSGERATGMGNMPPANNRTLTNDVYVDALDRVLSTINKMHKGQQESVSYNWGLS